MKLASFHWRGRDRIGFALDDDALIDLAEVAAEIGAWAPIDMLALIEAGERGQKAAARRARLRRRRTPARSTRIPIDDMRWHPPVRRPSKICGIALNNSASDARKITAPDHPLFFLKPASCLVGHSEPIEVYDYYGSVHPEPELAVIIGKSCRNVSAEDAMSVVYGYSIMNDMTGNGMRAQDMVHYYALYPKKDNPNKTEKREQHLSYTARYKGSDTFGPFGPWLVTKDDIPDPHALDVQCWHKDDLIAEDSTAYYTYSVPRAIEFITKYHSLWPGDVISMGTAFRPSRPASAACTPPTSPTLGGPVKVTISGIGTLENPVRRHHRRQDDRGLAREAPRARPRPGLHSIVPWDGAWPGTYPAMRPVQTGRSQPWGTFACQPPAWTIGTGPLPTTPPTTGVATPRAPPTSKMTRANNNMNKHTQVIIVGGGPVGVALAVELGLRGISCALVERRQRPAEHPQGPEPHPAHAGAFLLLGHRRRAARRARDAAGLPDRRRSPPTAASMSEYWHAAARPRAGAPTTTSRTTTACRSTARKRCCARRSRRCRASTGRIRLDGDSPSSRTTTACASPSTEEGGAGRDVLEADYVVGCDGARSMVREQVGIERGGHGLRPADGAGGVPLARAAREASSAFPSARPTA